MEQFENFPLVLRKSKKRRCQNHLKRFINKSGHLNIQLLQVPHEKFLRFAKDFANTFLMLRWRWVVVLVVLLNAFFYAIFAGLWMFDAYLSDDFNITKRHGFCIEKTRSYTGYLLLSIETITTTGYGYLNPTENCTIVFVTLTLSTIVMILLDGAFISMVYLKFSKPSKRCSLFSKKAVICLRNGKLCLVVRVFDHSNKHLINSVLNMYFINKTEILKGEIAINLEEMQVKRGLLLWPCEVVHEINSSSPLYTISAHDLFTTQFELIVTLSGLSLVTSQNSISKSSFLNEEILWGYRFKNCMEFHHHTKQYKIYESNVFKVAPCDTPLCSAKKLWEIKEEIRAIPRK